MHIHIGIDPVFATIGPLELTWHGLASAIAIVAAVWMIRRELARRGDLMPRYDEFAFWTIVAGIIGARLFFFIDHPSLLLDDPLEFFRFTDGGLAIYGALIGGFVGVAILCPLYGISFRRVIDATAPGLLVAQAIGRIGCAINGDAWGGPTSSSFAFVYTNSKALLPNDLIGVPTHPYPIYDMALCLAVLGVLWALRGRALPAGARFTLYAVLYSFGRFFISLVREERVWFWGLQEAQVISLAVVVVGVAVLAWLYARDDARSVTPATVGVGQVEQL